MKVTVRVCDRHRTGENVSADETVTLRVGSDEFELDLCPAHIEEYRAFEMQQQQWIDAAHASTVPPKTPRTRDRKGSLENAAIREWARTQGMDLGSRGRISDSLREQYRAEIGRQAQQRWDAAVSPAPSVDGERPVPVPAP